MLLLLTPAVTLPIQVWWKPLAGEELVLRGLSQRELLNQSSDRFISSDLTAAARFQRGQRVAIASLFGFKVTPEYCPAFERRAALSRD